MPELPEVEVIKKGLEPLLAGRRVLQAGYGKPLRLPFPRSAMKEWIQGGVVQHLSRRGKYLIILMTNQAAMVFHLGMSGRLLVLPRTVPFSAHDHVRLTLDNKSVLRLHDPRRFGSLQITLPDVTGGQLSGLFQRMGPEPLSIDFTPATLHRGTRGRKRAIKDLLLDGRIVAGIGNIYASETLFRAKIHPATQAGLLNTKQCALLHQAIKEVLVEAINSGGSSISDFTAPDGSAGYFQFAFKVYGRENLPCRLCGAPISRLRQSGRSTFFCPACQQVR